MRANYTKLNNTNKSVTPPPSGSIQGIYWAKLIEENIFIKVFDDMYGKIEKQIWFAEIYNLVGVTLNFFRKLNIVSTNEINNFNIRPSQYVPPK